MERTNRFSKITSFFAVCAGITAASICVLLISGEYHSARSKFEIHSQQVQGWEACRQANPGYYEANEKAVGSSLENLAESQSNFWVKMPKLQLAGCLAVGGLGSAAMGYLSIWAIFLLSRSGIRGFLRYREFRRLDGCPN